MGLFIAEPAAISQLSHRLTASTLADLAREITNIGPGIAKAKWKYEPVLSWKTKTGSGLDVTLNMKFELFMPVWMNVTERPDKEKREWRRWHAALRFHENGHHDICRREVKTMYQRMCAASPNTISKVIADEKKRIYNLNKVYDHNKGHGTKQVTPMGSTIMQVPPP